jgi:acyl-CoA oxidase
MLNRYVKVLPDGRVVKRGNPKIGYATMMLIRRQISTKWPYVFGPAISIAVKYSIKRRQFKEQGEEVSVLDYQCQQQKIIPAIADYYAMVLVGKKIDKLAERNYELILKDDDSLMSETHCILCFSKVFTTEMGLHHLEWLRLACGGHGYSHFSGLPSIYLQSLANVTLEGENTILLLQTAKTLLKAANAFQSEQREMPPSMRYLENVENFLNRPCSVPEGSPLLVWNIENIRILLAQSTSFLLLKCRNEFLKWTAELGLEKAVVGKMGLRMAQLARAHSIYFYYSELEATVARVSDEAVREALFNLCMMFGVNQILANPNSLLESGLLSPAQLDLLKDLFEDLLLKIRDNAIGFVDAMGQLDIVNRTLIGSDLDDHYERMY